MCKEFELLYNPLHFWKSLFATNSQGGMCAFCQRQTAMSLGIFNHGVGERNVSMAMEALKQIELQNLPQCNTSAESGSPLAMHLRRPWRKC